MNDRLLTSNIVETLGRNGAQEVEELFKSIQKLHSELNRFFFDRLLMSLEIQGLIRVNNTTKNKRRIELVRV